LFGIIDQAGQVEASTFTEGLGRLVEDRGGSLANANPHPDGITDATGILVDLGYPVKESLGSLTDIRSIRLLPGALVEATL
jgi:hypothetical protein